MNERPRNGTLCVRLLTFYLAFVMTCKVVVTYGTCRTVLTIMLGAFSAVFDPNRFRCLVQ